MSFCPMGSNYGSYILLVVLETRLNRKYSLFIATIAIYSASNVSTLLETLTSNNEQSPERENSIPINFNGQKFEITEMMQA